MMATAALSRKSRRAKGGKMELQKALRIGAIALAFATQACTYFPQHGDALQSGDKTQFIGFATAPSLSIRIEAKWPVDGNWYLVGTTTASATEHGASYPTFSRPLYQWSKSFTVPSWAFSSNQATLRARQEFGSDFIDTYMYDDAGWDCLVDRYIAAGAGPLDVNNAGIECSDDRHEITLHR
jgi:hypothetical protein